MSVKMKFGSKDIPFVYKGDKLVYPNPIKDGLLLWYDFKGMRNTDTNKEVAKDLSGNGNDGTLTNFNFTEESGYKDNTLVFDGVDDSLTIPEIALDETAMSVMHDGKIYSYEDDKVLAIKDYSDKELAYLESLRANGRNLIRGSEFKEQTSYYTYQNIDAELSGGVLIATNKITTSYPRIFYRPLGDLIVGEEYTISFKARGNTDFTASFWISDANGGKSQLPSQNVSYTKKWKSYTFTFTANENLSDSTAIQWWVNKTNPDTIQSLFLKEVKLEKGTVATDWTPAPEDVRENLPGLEAGGRNLLPSFYNSAWYKRQSDFVISPYHLRSAKGVNHAIVATIVLDVKPNTDYSIFMNTDLGRTRVSSDSGSGDIMGYRSDGFPRVFNTGTNESVEVELGVFSGNLGEEINFSNVMLCQGRLTQRSFTPAPEDFQTTSLSPLSLSNLQLYNRPLRKSELLHNAESKGLKELVDGVIVQDGLLIHYDFSHESNTSEYKDKAFDYSGNGNHGVLQNFGYAEGSGYDGNKLKFDGVDDRVVLITELPTVCTYEATFVRTSGFSWKPPMSSLQISSARETGFAMTPVANGIVVSAGNGVDRYKHHYFYTDPIPENELTHLVTSYDGASFSVYLNGIFIGTQAYDLVQNNYLNLGNWSRYTGSGYWYDWETHSAKIYNRPLTAEEITHNYQIEKEKFNTI